MRIFFITSLFCVVLADIHTPYGTFSTKPISPADREWLRMRPQTREAFPPGFKFMYVAQDGHMVPDNRPTNGSYIEVVASPAISMDELRAAALEVSKELRYSPAVVYDNIAKYPGAGLGVFTAREKISIFPEYASQRDTPACKGRCDGPCRPTCLWDGRKIDSLAGVTGTRAVVLIDNVLCLQTDPYLHHDNILVHEFAHCVEKCGLTDKMKQEVIDAYENARKHAYWRLDSYAMANHAEYFAEATGAFFLVNMQSTTGGMTECPGQQCRSQKEVRWWLASKDLPLYKVLVEVYTDHRPTVDSGVTICEKPQPPQL